MEIWRSIHFLVWSNFAIRSGIRIRKSIQPLNEIPARRIVIWHFHFHSFVEETVVNKQPKTLKYYDNRLERCFSSLQQCSHFALLWTILRNNLTSRNKTYYYFTFTYMVLTNCPFGSIDSWIMPSLVMFFIFTKTGRGGVETFTTYERSVNFGNLSQTSSYNFNSRSLPNFKCPKQLAESIVFERW